MKKTDQIKAELDAITAMKYDFGGMRVYHSGDIDMDKIERFYRHAPSYIRFLLDELERAQLWNETLSDGNADAKAKRALNILQRLNSIKGRK